MGPKLSPHKLYLELKKFSPEIKRYSEKNAALISNK